MKIQETQTYQNLDNLQNKIYTSKNQSDVIEHLVKLTRNRDIQFMINTHHPNSIQLGIVKDIING